MRAIRTTTVMIVTMAAALVGVPVEGTAPASAALAPRPVTTPHAPDAEAAIAMRHAPAAAWPAAGVVETTVDGSLARAGSLPVRVARSSAQRVRLEVLDRTATAKAGIRGVLMSLSHDGDASPTTVEVDYSGFAAAYGGNYGSRLTMATVRGGRVTPVATVNDGAAKTVRAAVPDGLVAVLAAPGGPTGSYQPTSLAPSSSWQVGLQSGDFLWSYPIDVPAMAGPMPPISLDYSSGSVDGRVASTNNQPDWVGEGFSYQPGFIERSYATCRDDGTAADDLCFESQNARLVMPGLSGELVLDAADGTTWRLEQDRGWRVERLFGAPNGDNDGEYWRLTSPHGVQYYFGRSQLPEAAAGAPSTNSTWTVPVYGNNSGEPCSAAPGWCTQAYRWNLDFVIDRHGDASAYYYDTETNYYARGGTTPTQYVRGGVLNHVDYGLRVGSVYTATSFKRVVFTAGDRCIPGTACVQSQPGNWPDVPWDQWCDATGCGIPAPTFWSARRLATITTQWFSAGQPHDIDSWALSHVYPAVTGSTAALWLNSIVHTGLSGQTPIVLPAVTFDAMTSENRVDGADTESALYKLRVNRITTEAGGQIDVAYAPRQCTPATMIVADANDKRCYPVFYGSGPTASMFHKYVVSQVTESSLSGASPAVVTAYEYVANGAAWHYDDGDLVPPARKSWGQFRGFQTVRVRKGTGGQRTLTEYTFLRGMAGDRLATGDPRSVTVDGVTDKAAWRGFARITDVYLGDGGPLVSRTVAQPTDSSPTASRPRTWSGVATWGRLEAHLTDVAWEQTTTTVSGGSSRTTRSEYTYDPTYGTLSRISELGDVSTSADDTCEDVTYARNTTDWIIDAISRELVTGKTCGAAPTMPVDLIGDRRSYHDGATSWGGAPSSGDVTRTEEAISWSDGPVYQTTARSVLDGHGRPLETYDGAGNQTRYAYTPALGGPVTQTSVTDARNFTTTSTLDPARGGVLSVADANGSTTSSAYDALGRLVDIWLPGRATTDAPSTEFGYTVRTDGPNVVTTRRLIAGTAYVCSYEFLDGLLRTRQTQQVSPRGGRIVTDTLYDSAGRIAAIYPARYDGGSAGADLAAGFVPAQTDYVYDRAGRVTDEIFVVGTTEAWRTTTSYGGSWTAVDPPAGGTATMRLTDPLGRLVELRQYASGAPTGAYDATLYTYTKGGRLATATDPAGNVWRYGYDLRGRRTSGQAPDSGSTVSTVDADGRTLTTTDARGQTLAYAYDALGRRTGLFSGSTSGTKLAEWTYDTALLGKGRLGSAIRYSGAAAYTDQVTKYDNRGRYLERTVTIPAVEGALAGAYTTRWTYNEMDEPLTLALPAGGTLPVETLQLTYDSLGLPKTQRTLPTWYVKDATYTTLGEPESVTLGPVGAQIRHAYAYEDGTRRLAGERTDVVGGAALADVAYAYDAADNVLSRTDAVSGDSQCLRYDHLRRLTEAYTVAGCAAPSAGTLSGPAPYWRSYTYDLTGNRLSDTLHTTSGNLVRTYGYPAAGAAQPHTLRSVTATGPGAGPAESYAYDIAGDVTGHTADSISRTAVWDAEGRLTSVTDGSDTTSALYDADGQRLLRRDPGGTTLYLGDTELRLSGGTVTGTRYYRHGGTVVAVRAGSSVSYLAPEPQGGASLAVAAGSLVPTRRYGLPFGGPRGTVPSWPGELGFAGGAVDTATGLVQLGARSYDPATGRFLSRDPVVDHADPQQLQAYAYAVNNPFAFVDPDGRKPQPIECCSGQPRPKTVEDVLSHPRVSAADDGPVVLDVDSGDDGSDSAPVEYHYAPRPCAGWTQCLFPRPWEWFDSAGNRRPSDFSPYLPFLLGWPGGQPRGPIAQGPPKPGGLHPGPTPYPGPWPWPGIPPVFHPAAQPNDVTTIVVLTPDEPVQRSSLPCVVQPRPKNGPSCKLF